MEPAAPKARLKCVQCGYEAEVTARKDLTVGKMIPGLCPDCQGNMIVTKDITATQHVMLTDKVLEIVKSQFPVHRVEEGYNHLRLEVGEPYSKESFPHVLRQLESTGFLAIVRKFGDRNIMTVFPKVQEANVRVRNNLILLGLTVLSTFAAGLFLTGFLSGAAMFEVAKWDAILYSVGIMSILGLHEMGHKLGSMRYKVEATYPYFIPVPWPFILGTMGAIIKMKGSLPDRNSMLRIGAAGPICGFLVAIPVTMVGLALSTPEVAAVHGGPSILIGASPLFRLLRNIVVPNAYGLSLHPLAVAGWAGMLVTMLNLLPAGMLDGGHVTRAVFGMRIHRMFGYLTGFSLLAIFLLQQFTGASFAGWLLWGVLALFFSRVGHPGSLDESSKLSRTSLAIGAVVLAIFVLAAVPLPIRLVDQPKVYVSTFTASPISISEGTYLVHARLGNQARLSKVQGIEARIILPAGAALLSGSSPVINLPLLSDRADLYWNVTLGSPKLAGAVYCVVDSENGGSDEARLRLSSG